MSPTVNTFASMLTAIPMEEEGLQELLVGSSTRFFPISLYAGIQGKAGILPQATALNIYVKSNLPQAFEFVFSNGDPDDGTTVPAGYQNTHSFNYKTAQAAEQNKACFSLWILGRDNMQLFRMRNPGITNMELMFQYYEGSVGYRPIGPLHHLIS